MTLHLGSEIFNIFRSDIDKSSQHLFTREGETYTSGKKVLVSDTFFTLFYLIVNGLQGQAVLKSKISIR